MAPTCRIATVAPCLWRPCLAPFHSCLSSTRTAATKGRSFRRRRSAQWRRSTLKSSSDPTASEGSSFYRSAGLLRGLSHGSTAVADWRKTGSVSAERPSHSYGSPQSGSCCESYAFKRDVRGQTLTLQLHILLDMGFSSDGLMCASP